MNCQTLRTRFGTFCQVYRMASYSTRGTSPTPPSIMQSKKLIYPAATRNQGPILEVLTEYLPMYLDLNNRMFCLEIASGSGQHLAYFAPKFPNITFQPTDYSNDVLNSIVGYAEECPTKNINRPFAVDIRDDLGIHNFQRNSIDIIYCANMIHISPFPCTVGLFKNAGNYLKPNGLLITYGAYARNGVITPQSNVDFDRSLRSQNPEWGVRCLDQLSLLARENNIILKNVFDLPANNKCVIWRKELP